MGHEEALATEILELVHDNAAAGGQKDGGEVGGRTWIPLANRLRNRPRRRGKLYRPPARASIERGVNGRRACLHARPALTAGTEVVSAKSFAVKRRRRLADQMPGQPTIRRRVHRRRRYPVVDRPALCGARESEVLSR